MIQSFQDRATREIFNNQRAGRLPHDIQSRAKVKLNLIHAASSVEDFRFPPGNRLEALSGDLSCFHSIRINNQWRIIFRWENGHAHDVKITDYH